MDSFKIKLYEQEYNKPFPSFKHLTIRECEVIKKKFFFDFQVDNDLKLVNEIRRNEIYINNFDANNEQDFNIKKYFNTQIKMSLLKYILIGFVLITQIK